MSLESLIITNFEISYSIKTSFYLMQQENNPNVWFFLLINTKSGGEWGKCYLELKKKHFSFQYKKQKVINIKLVDLFDVEKKTQQLLYAKNLQQNNINDVRIIICGGDGTIIWGIQQCHQAGLNFQKLLFASLPIGTGNDFTRTIGWGSKSIKIVEGNILPLKKRVIQWLNAETTFYDIWQVQITLYQKGQMYAVKNKQDTLINKKQYKIGFVNYVGIGIDARVSYNFQKNRKSTQLMNLAVYGCLGLIFCCKKIPQLANTAQSFQQIGQMKDQLALESPGRLKLKVLDDSMVQTLNNSKSRSSRKINLKSGYHGLICLNSISYMAGAIDAWKTNKIGCVQKQHKFKDQYINDGIIQFIGYKDQLRLGLQKICHSGAKIAQGQGPFRIKFKQDNIDEQNYIQIDGQGLKLKGIKEIVIKRNQTIPWSRIRVMVNKKLGIKQ